MPVDALHPQYKAAQSDWKLMRDFIAGEQAVKDAGEEYLSKTPGQILDKKNGQERYEAFKNDADFPERVEPAIDWSVGFIHQKDAVIELPSALDGLKDSITPSGLDMHGLHRKTTRNVLSVGRIGLAVDMVQDVPNIVTYSAESIRNWKVAKVDGKFKPSLLVLAEGAAREVDEFEDEAVDALLVYQIVNGIVWVRRFEKPKDSQEYKEQEVPEKDQPRKKGKRLTDIPFIFVGSSNLDPAPDKIPFIGLARKCRSIYRLSARYVQSLSFSEPTHYVTGMTDAWIKAGRAPKTVGSGTVWHLPSGAEAGMIEYNGKIISEQREALDTAKAEAADLAAKPFEPRTASVESGEAKKERTKGSTSTIFEVAMNTAAGLEAATKIAADWAGSNPDDVKIIPNKDLIMRTLTAQDITALIAGWQAEGYSKQTMHENFQRGGLSDRDFETEQQLIEEEGLGL